MVRIFIVILFLSTTVAVRAFSQATLYYDNSVKVFKGNTPLQDPWAGGINAGQFGMIDFNGDGIKDLVVYDRTSNRLNLFRYDSGNYVFAPEYNDLFPGDLYGFVVIRDYNRDGLPDLFTSGKQGLKAYRNITEKGGKLKFEVASDPVYTLTNSGLLNLEVNYTDIPSIDDIDGDGDLDILVYNFALGKDIRFHKNMSMEDFGNPDSLDFKLVDQRWGQFEECNCDQFAFTTLGETCDNLQNGRTKHIGGKSLLLIDMNGDGVQDLLMGHENCNELYFFPNTGTKEQALFTSFTGFFPDTLQAATLPVFPSGFYDDFDHDGIKDLVVSPNDMNNLLKNIDYSNSVWFYKNTGKNDKPSFHLKSKNFLQGQMIDVGENAKPLLTDVDHDGDLDLLVAGNGYLSGGTYYGYVTFYKNSGTQESPVFQLADSDFLNLSSLRLYDLFIAAADFNGDGIPDYFVSGTVPFTDSVSSRIAYVSSAPDQPVQFRWSSPDQFNVPLNINDTPCFTDVNNDGLVDVLVGRNTGRLDYYRNVGNKLSPTFRLEQNDYLGIIDSYYEFRKNLVPFTADIDLDGKDDLITSDYLGELFVYFDYRGAASKEQMGFYNHLLGKDEIWTQGYQTWITAGNLYKGKFPVIILGNKQGGLTFYRQELPGTSDEENILTLHVYPNPLRQSSVFNIKASQSGDAVIYSLLGQPVSPSLRVTANRALPVDMVNVPQGLYIVRVTDLQGRTVSARLMINR